MKKLIKPELCKDRKTLNKIELAEYFAEKKYDGERIIAIKKDDDIILQRRSGKIATHQYPEIVNALESFKYDIILDGEICVFIDGIDNFNEGLSPRTHLKDENKIQIKAAETPAQYMVFDVLYAHNADLREKPLYTRKDYLEAFYKKSILDTVAEQFIKRIEYGDDGEGLLKDSKLNGWEGIVLKPKGSMYIENSRKQWIKIKNTHDADLFFTDYEVNNRGIKLLKYSYVFGDEIHLTATENKPIAVQCGGIQAEKVRKIIDDNGKVYATISFLGITTANRLRMPVFKKINDIIQIGMT